MCTPSKQSISITIKIWIKINKRVILGTVIDENLTLKPRFSLIKSKFLKHKNIGIMFIVRP